ncbi:uncharacterized protein AKAW2_11903S [Aspergillus luchuensis]|uniref:Uncharacterized protein n=1 Tax=Aspergillus kawachii TaxID=1069201 RepID=A0A7R7W1V8_ASPKA|nr:uncharacterized protein AKAW2_11903S [Aspergillus luchuensis]BCR94857.1 hypothetical protein AKAW2_11903S [Aspergillus luchuensis]
MGLPLPPHIKIRMSVVLMPLLLLQLLHLVEVLVVLSPPPPPPLLPLIAGPLRFNWNAQKLLMPSKMPGLRSRRGFYPPRDLTEGQKLRKKELREEIARLKEREREHNEALRVKTEQWDTARKGLVDAVERHDSERAESFAPDYQLSKELDEQIKSAVAEIKGLEHNIFFTRFTACI